MANRYNIRAVDADGRTDEALNVDDDRLKRFWEIMVNNPVEKGNVVTVEVIEE